MMLDRDLFEFFEHTADATFSVSDSGEICSWNGSAERLFGFARVEAIGKTCFELFQGRDVLGTLVCTEHCHLRDCASLGTLMPDFDLEVTVRSGGRMWVNISTIVYEDSKTGRRRIVHLARSVDGRKRTEALVQGVLEMSRQLVAKSDEGERPAPVAPVSEQELRILSRFSQGRQPRRDCARVEDHVADIAESSSSHQPETRDPYADGSGPARDSSQSDQRPVRDCQTSDCGRAPGGVRWGDSPDETAR